MSDTDPFAGAEVIYAYTRERAIADGVLVDASRRAKALGFSVPVAMTRAVYENCVAWEPEDNERKHGMTAQDKDGRMHDVLWMTFLAVMGAGGRDRVGFAMLRVPREGRGFVPRKVDLIAHIGPGDAGEPVITIMEPGED